MTNQDIVDNFFDSYVKRDLDGVENIMAGNVVQQP
jgi:ketosteroid isomerase-like protein